MDAGRRCGGDRNGNAVLAIHLHLRLYQIETGRRMRREHDVNRMYLAGRRAYPATTCIQLGDGRVLEDDGAFGERGEQRPAELIGVQLRLPGRLEGRSQREWKPGQSGLRSQSCGLVRGKLAF